MFFSSLLFFWLIPVVVCVHFNGGTTTWRPLNASATETPVAILITQTYIWSYISMACTASMVASNQLVRNYLGLATKKLQCISNCGGGSVGYSNLSIIPYCISGSPALGTTIGQRSDIVNLTSGDDFSVAYQDSNWRALATGSAASWSLTSRITLTQRSDNDLYNNAPISTMMSPSNIPINKTIVINIPVRDDDDDILRCRWASSSNGVDECGGVCPLGSLPSATVLYPNCTIVITGQSVSNWYAVAVMIEDFINFTSTTSLSSVPVQFLVYVVSSPSCPLPQVVERPSSGSCKAVVVGQMFTSQLIATSYCGSNVSIVDISIQAFSNLTQSNVSQLNFTTFYKNITWIPSSIQTGYQILCAMTIDSQGSQSLPYCFNYYVSTNSLCSCPNGPCSITTITTTTTTSSSSTSATQSTSTSTTSKTTTSSTISTATSTTSTSVTTRSTTSITQSTTTSITLVTSTTSTATTITQTYCHLTATSASAYVYISSSSTTSTTANTTAPSTIPITDSIDRSSSEPKDANLHKWIVIGSIVGIPLLLALIVGGCLCWYYCSPCGIGRIKLSNCQESFEFYHFNLSTKPESNNRQDQNSVDRVLSDNDNDSLILQNNIDTTEYITLDVSNRLAIRRKEKEQSFDDEYTNSIVESKSPSKPERENSLKEHRRTRIKPNRVTVISLPPSTSQSTLDYPNTISNYHTINQTPDYERNIDNVRVRHIRWPQRWTRNAHRSPQFDSID